MKMKYYVVEVIFYNNGQKDSPAIYTFEDETAAIARFHKEMGAWMGKEEVDHVQVMCMNSEGGIYKNEVWNRPQPEPEPVPPEPEPQPEPETEA